MLMYRIYEFIGEVILKINIVLAEKIKAEVYVNQHESVSHIQTPSRNPFTQPTLSTFPVGGNRSTRSTLSIYTIYIKYS